MGYTGCGLYKKICVAPGVRKEVGVPSGPIGSAMDVRCLASLMRLFIS
jgi:hypothetical protein